MENKFILGKGKDPVFVNLSRLNRHGFITGATGSGKTITLKVIAENLSKNGIPVFLSDIKGDVASLAEKGEMNEKIAERVNLIGLEEYENRKYPIELFDVFGQDGISLRTSISEMGPILLSKLLGLNPIQEGVLNIAFKIADERGLLIIDIKDLRAMLNFVGDNATELSNTYGNISKQTVGAILRALLVLEEQGGDIFFGEPSFNVLDFLKKNENGEGIINILACDKLFGYPKLYSTFLLWLLSELYENLPEVGDLDKPKIVFFFDEAHLLFEEGMKVLIDKIEMIVRLIRSKGVGIFFVTQKATDIPNDVLAQLGNRVQHALNAYTPKEQKEVKAIADSFRQEGEVDLVEEILNLRTGEAIVSVLGEDSKPGFAQKTMISPPESKMGAMDPSLRMQIINSSYLYEKYQEAVDSTSAYEVLSSEKQEAEERALKEKEEKELEKIRASEAKLAEKERIAEEKRIEKLERQTGKKTDSVVDRLTKNIAGSVGRELGRMITRGLFGGRKR
ncbi:MAG: DUF853 family protein [Tissierellia bacterium]|nr:DUF853 family protein [Tissierellia bacterium]